MNSTPPNHNLGIYIFLDGLDVFDPKRIADRILGFGDAVSLVEKAQGVLDEKKADVFQKKIGFFLKEMKRI